MNDTDIIIVCDECLTSCCCQGIFYCENSETAGTTEKTIKELKKLNLEHPDYWETTKKGNNNV